MLDADEAAKKIAAATLELKRAKEAHADGKRIKVAERRLALLLRLYAGLKDDPEFKTGYQREMAACKSA